MNKLCRAVQDRLLEGGPAALREDPPGQRHLEECEECFALLESLTQLEETVAALPPVDAPNATVVALLARPELLVPERLPERVAAAPARRFWQRLIAPISGRFKPHAFPLRTAALMAVLSLAVALSFMVPREPTLQQIGGEASRVEMSPEPTLKDLEEQEIAEAKASGGKVEGLKALGYVGGADLDDVVFGVPDSPAAPQPEAVPLKPERAKKKEPVWVGTETEISFRGAAPRVESDAVSPFADRAPTAEKVQEHLRERLNELPRGAGRREAAARDADLLAGEAQPGDGKSDEQRRVDRQRAGQQTVDQLLKEAKNEPTEGLEAEEMEAALSNKAQALALAGGDQLAEIFLAERARLEGLRFQPAEGYWANTYVPGDPALRHLQASLARRDRAALEAHAPAPLGLHDAVRRPSQPFDPPENAALAVYLHADRAALEGRQRLLVQVGLQASERLGGRRPAMNLAVVLDLRGEISTASATTLRALLTAFAQARDLGDRFRLVVVGRPGGEVVGPASFHHGPVAVTLERLLSGEASGAPTLGLAEALATASAAVSREDDPTAPLGSSAVILVTDQPLAADTATLGRLAHRSALQGVTVSVVGVGERVELDELERLALAGQGHRRLLHSPAEAVGVVDRELAAVGRAVARAVRLRIRLAPGVELIDVLGSHRLDLVAAERVRQAEQSLDRRLSQNLGITADRGDDEDGIQIVIPSFYAGDSHVVLLDLVAPGPGPIADVQVRFKDLVYFENGVARGHLALDRGFRPAGPLERNVLKNLLAFDARGVFEDAGRLLAEGQPKAARERLSTFRQLLLGLGRALSDLTKDQDLERDISLLGEYIALLDAGVSAKDEARSHLADSLRLAGRLKVLPRPAAASEQ